MTILSELLTSGFGTEFDLEVPELDFLGWCLGCCLNGCESVSLFLTLPTAVLESATNRELCTHD